MGPGATVLASVIGALKLDRLIDIECSSRTLISKDKVGISAYHRM